MTDSLEIYITSEDGGYIAMVEDDVTFTPLRGEIATIVDATVKTVQESTMVVIELIPEHAIYLEDEPVIEIEFPTEVQIQTPQCKIQDVSLTGSTD